MLKANFSLDMQVSLCFIVTTCQVVVVAMVSAEALLVSRLVRHTK